MRLEYTPSDSRDPNADEARKILKEALSAWGSEEQFRMAQEESAELIAVINQFFRRRVGPIDLASEVADVLIMATQVAMIIDQDSPGLVDSLIGHKVLRLKNKLASLEHEEATQPE